MESEKEWLEKFKRNLEDTLNKYDDIRDNIIIWEIDWINKRLEEISKWED